MHLKIFSNRLYRRIRAIRFVPRLLTVLELQLTVMALSLPVILAQGMPISLLAVAGNVLFTPFLFGFLLLASLIFITQMFALPNMMLITALDYFRRIWLACMAHVDGRVMLELPSPGLAGAALLFISALCLIMLRIQSIRIRCTLLFSFLIISCTGLYFCARPAHAYLAFKHGAGTLHVCAIDTELSMIDDGIRSHSGLKSFLAYSVIPKVRAQCGTTRISTLVFLKPTSASSEIARLLFAASCTQPDNCTIILPARAHPEKPDSEKTHTRTKTEQAANQLESRARAICPNTVRILDQTSQKYSSKNHTFEVSASGTLQRTKNYAHTLLRVQATCGQKKILIEPLNLIKTAIGE